MNKFKLVRMGFEKKEEGGLEVESVCVKKRGGFFINAIT